MIRRVYLVYDIVGDKIISSHIEDINTGEIFEAHVPKITLSKEPVTVIRPR